MVSAQTLMSSSRYRQTTSRRRVLTSSAEVSFILKTFWMISFSSFSMVPCWLPSISIILISSSVTTSSFWLGSMPSSRSKALVDTVSSQTSGAHSLDMKYRMPDSCSDRASVFFMARRLGTSSPNTMLK